MKKLLLAILITASSLTLAKGNLVIIGGGDRPESVLRKIIELAGGIESRIVIIPNASSEPLESAEYQIEQFNKFGAFNVNYILFTRETADADSTIEKINGATGAFFSGGDQSRLTADLLGTKLLDKIIDVYDNGGVITGTSAGAAVMSKIMITGDEIKYPDDEQAFARIESDNIKTTEGFGFVKDAIIDQHFIMRKRYNRLISLLLEKRSPLGIGIDESTAIIVYADNTFEVLGESQVIVFDASDSVMSSSVGGKLGGTELKLHILLSGDKFDLSTKKVMQ